LKSKNPVLKAWARKRIDAEYFCESLNKAPIDKLTRRFSALNRVLQEPIHMVERALGAFQMCSDYPEELNEQLKLTRAELILLQCLLAKVTQRHQDFTAFIHEATHREETLDKHRPLDIACAHDGPCTPAEGDYLICDKCQTQFENPNK
jgi:hypothetical protein